mmetsp:Transcript_140947/g.438166  ORF Transcript_140947/g.438166 Transcript_140947/m.438166 type:complete len:320 (+) Transcript_140947:53-1012(+)|eukprot:CAMPEP_0204590486 /NCGR_PEP_ID=MMETSP0661-20131031/49815_1 /ASSEMBLY_ACC=CAM_ASM_000606 /TAXON_ID=109239 /ORGANISM="Alexandrium margalefi, Strain AMGDE01CS-322" /LENGTH=319 /DNA_ID=CAMNT_0051600519 /DNA_START=24 /DNA_END=983 /DNA_ORIENTATION=+
MVLSPGPAAACLLLHAGLLEAASQPQIHMVTFTTDMYQKHFAESLEAKQAYAKHWGYSWEVFDEDTLSCSDFRPHRWRGDFRYCKLQALKVMWKRVVEQRKQTRGRRDYIFWHDVDTHIMRPETPLESFLEAAGHAPVVFTDNALSLNNGVFFLEVSKPGGRFLGSWRRGCRTGEWPWADNGCMYEVLLSTLGGDRYGGRCRKYREPELKEDRPEPPTGAALMHCFNKEMDALGMGCCGKARGIDGFAFLTGPEESFNHHPCHELERSKDFQDVARETIRQHCFTDGMFMVHTKNSSYVHESLERAHKFTSAKVAKGEL